MNKADAAWSELVDLGLCSEYKGKISATQAGLIFNDFTAKVKLTKKQAQLLFDLIRAVRKRG